MRQQRYHFQNPYLLAQFARKLDAERRANPDLARDTQWGYELNLGSIPKSLRGYTLLETGDDSIVPQARKLIDQLALEIPTVRRMWETQPVRFFPNVPAYLAGQPENMFMLREDRVDHTPLRIWVGTSCTWDVNEADLIKRGAALTAFGMALSERRPVAITPYWQLVPDTSRARSSISEVWISYDLSMSPFVLSQMGCLANPLITRHAWLYTVQMLETARSVRSVPYHATLAHIKQALNPAPDDIVLNTADSWDPLIKKPVPWIKQQLAHYLNDEEDDD